MNSSESDIIQTLTNAGCPIEDKRKGLRDLSTQDVFCSVARLLNIIAEEQNASWETFPCEWPGSLSVRYNLGIKMAERIEGLGCSDIGYQTFIHEDASSTKDLGRLFHFLIDKLPFKSFHSHESVNKDNLTSTACGHRHSNLLKPAKDLLSAKAYSSLSEHMYANRRDVISSSLKKIGEHDDEFSKEMLLNLQSTEETLKQDLQIKEKRKEELKLEVESLKTQLEEVTSVAAATEASISESERNMDVLRKVNHIIKDDESIAKLRDLIEKRRAKRQTLQRQWEEGLKPLENEYEGLVLKLKELKQKEYSKSSNFNRIKKEIQETEEQIRTKETKLSTKSKQCDEMIVWSPRSFYTDRIVNFTFKIDEKSSVINAEIESLKSVQKDINSLSSQLERTFTETEAKLFRVASEDSNLVGAYKILMKWQGNCEEVMQGMRTQGKIQKDIQDLERKCERERSRDFDKKIERVKSDISLLSKEDGD